MKFNTISYYGYLYRVITDIETEAVKHVLGNVEIAPRTHFGLLRGTSVNFKIENDRLYIKYLQTCLTNESESLLNTDIKAKIECLKQNLIVTCEDLDVFFPYSGKIEAYQYYVDEVEVGFKTHSDKSNFGFSLGNLEKEGSKILKNDTKFITSVTWDETKPTKGGENGSNNWYLVDPEGSCMQNTNLLGVHVNYVVTHQITDKMLRELLNVKKPILRCVIMQETKSGSNKYELNTNYDLVRDFIINLDVQHLEQVYPYIQFEKYKDYPERMMFALFNESGFLKENRTDEGVAILKLFVEKGLKLDNVDKYVTLATENISDEQIKTKLITLLNESERK